MTEEHLKIVQEEVKKAVKETVNGQIKEFRAENNLLMEKINETIATHFSRMEPVVKAYEDEKTFTAGLKIVGDRTIFWGKIVMAIGIIVTGIFYIINNFNKP